MGHFGWHAGVLSHLLTECSSSPSVSDGEQPIEQRIKNECVGRIKLVQFHKTNGQSAEVNAVKVYTPEYDAEVEFLEACKWNIMVSGGVLMDEELHFGTRSLTDRSSMEAAMNLGTEVTREALKPEGWQKTKFL
ncbi:MAG: hypothetical protein ABSH34_23755 [Verrucomicrobiota bacterium]|jgi:hypothetical protein